MIAICVLSLIPGSDRLALEPDMQDYGETRSTSQSETRYAAAEQYFEEEPHPMQALITGTALSKMC